MLLAHAFQSDDLIPAGCDGEPPVSTRQFVPNAKDGEPRAPGRRRDGRAEPGAPSLAGLHAVGRDGLDERGGAPPGDGNYEDRRAGRGDRNSGGRVKEARPGRSQWTEVLIEATARVALAGSAYQFGYQLADDPKGRRDNSKDRPLVLLTGQGVATVAPGPTTGAGDAMLLLDRFAVLAQGVVVINVPVRGRVLGAVGVKRRFVRHSVAPLRFP